MNSRTSGRPRGYKCGYAFVWRRSIAISVEIIVSATGDPSPLSLSLSIDIFGRRYQRAVPFRSLPREGGFVNLDSSIKREESALGGSPCECFLPQVQQNVGHRFGKFAKPPRAISRNLRSLAVEQRERAGGCLKSTG